MNDDKVRLLQSLLEEFIAERQAEEKCTCSECLGWALRNWFYLKRGIVIK